MMLHRHRYRRGGAALRGAVAALVAVAEVMHRDDASVGVSSFPVDLDREGALKRALSVVRRHRAQRSGSNRVAARIHQSSRLSVLLGFDAQQPTREGRGSVPKHSGEFPKVHGAPQHEFC